MGNAVSKQPLEVGRKRGWLLLRVEEGKWPEVAKLKKLLKEGGSNYSVIRTDKVKFEDGTDRGWNVVIPVDAKDGTTFNTAKDRIQELFQPSRTIAAMVEEGGHHPWPPHNAHGYVTEEEFIRGKRESDFWHGLQGNSPGRNPWG